MTVSLSVPSNRSTTERNRNVVLMRRIAVDHSACFSNVHETNREGASERKGATPTIKQVSDSKIAPSIISESEANSFDAKTRREEVSLTKTSPNFICAYRSPLGDTPISSDGHCDCSLPSQSHARTPASSVVKNLSHV